MKNIAFLIFIVINFFNTANARFELQILNFSTTDFIYVKVFPIGAIFNGDYEYSLDCKYRLENVYDKIYGGDTILPKKIGQTPDIEFNHDYDVQNGGTNKAIGFGKYRVEFPPLLVLESAASVTGNEEKQNFGSNYDHKKYN